MDHSGKIQYYQKVMLARVKEIKKMHKVNKIGLEHLTYRDKWMLQLISNLKSNKIFLNNL